MNYLTLFSILLFSSFSFTSNATSSTLGVDPDSIDPELRRVVYHIGPKDIKISAYQGGSPSALELSLCERCLTKTYKLASDAEILLNETPLPLSELTIELIKKNFDIISLSINRDQNTVTSLYLGGVSELSKEESSQEALNEI